MSGDKLASSLVPILCVAVGEAAAVVLLLLIVPLPV
jgi:hypothetical protein